MKIYSYKASSCFSALHCYGRQRNSSATAMLFSVVLFFLCSIITIKAQYIDCCGACSNNLVVNSDFSYPNCSLPQAYSTDLPYYDCNPPYPPSLFPGVIEVADASLLGSANWYGYDHTTGNGTGRFLFVDGPSTLQGDQRVWYQNVSVVAGRRYNYVVWLRNGCRNCVTTPVFELQVNGQSLRTAYLASSSIAWTKFCVSYIAPATGTIELSILIHGADNDGNDGGIDDIFFGEVQVPSAAFTSVGDLCNEPVQFMSTGHQSGNNHLWLFGDSNGGFSFDVNPSYIYNSGGTYIVTHIVSNGCACDTLRDTLTIDCCCDDIKVKAVKLSKMVEGKCCYLIVVTPPDSACPVYGFKLYKGKTTIDSVHSSSVESSYSMEVCIDIQNSVQEFTVYYLDANGNVFCNPKKLQLECRYCSCEDLMNGIQSDQLRIELKPTTSEPGECCWDVNIHNRMPCALQTLGLITSFPPLPNIHIFSGDNTWHWVNRGILSGWSQYDDQHSISLIQTGSTRVGKICSAADGIRKPLTMTLGLHPSINDACWHIFRDTLFCPPVQESCCDHYKMGLLAIDGMPGCYHVGISTIGVLPANCPAIHGIRVVRTDEHQSQIIYSAVSLLPYSIPDFPALLYLTDVCCSTFWQTSNEVTVTITLFDINGNPVCTKSLTIDCRTGVIHKQVVHEESSNRKVESTIVNLRATPNPAAGQSHIQYTLTQDAVIKLEIFDYTGKCIRVLEESYKFAGEQTYTFDTSALPSGTYMMKLSSGTMYLTLALAIHQ